MSEEYDPSGGAAHAGAGGPGGADGPDGPGRTGETGETGETDGGDGTDGPGGPGGMDAGDAEDAVGVPDPYAERVLDAVELIPPGRVMTYGDVAEWLGEGGPRQVGRVMALYGGGVPWWRVVRADGRLLPGHEPSALAEYRAEGTPLRPGGPAAEGHVPRLDMRRARWDGRDGAGEG
ncbi:MGMT family protein [Actinacidiphila sp. DG2A-62]|uniref:MGMT family protein n=1 Tax=Actinacidiphila sp. DG2A-62 TaxID=3108821 RepID=UPI003FA3C68F